MDGYCSSLRTKLSLEDIFIRDVHFLFALGFRKYNHIRSFCDHIKGFKGLVEGDRWCLCAARWLEAYEAGMAPPVVLESTHEMALRIVPLQALLAHAWGQRPERHRNAD